jgi:hypothetical protein
MGRAKRVSQIADALELIRERLLTLQRSLEKLEDKDEADDSRPSETTTE